VEVAIAALVGIAIGYALALVPLRRRRAPDSAPVAAIEPASAAPAPEAPGPALREPLDVQRLLDIAAELESGEIERMAHPTDLLGNERFEAGVTLLTDSGASLEQTVDYCLGSNWVVGLMAALPTALPGSACRSPGSRQCPGGHRALVGEGTAYRRGNRRLRNATGGRR
jgi:hypothetical protein